MNFYAYATLILATIQVNKATINSTYSEGPAIENGTKIDYVPYNIEHPCKRECIKGAKPMECHYNFLVEWYQTMSKACYSCPDVLEDCFRPDCVIGDGTRRTIVSINRMVPGPTIEVCLGDRVIIEVENHLMGDTTTIHWHGHHQRDTPYMDGVPFVTQCPIQPGTSFTYNFSALNAGTHFWHSHTGMQRGDGAFGPFIVRVPEESDPHADLYDFDKTAHVISLLDWDVGLSLDMFVSHYHSIGDNKPANLLINGLGLHDFKNASSTPIARFFVQKGYRYRFRIVNAGFLNCPVEMSIVNHTMVAISSDGSDFEPIEVDSLVTYAGERFDFILNANQPEGLYWINFRGLMDCDERFTRAHQVAILQYDGTKATQYPKDGVPTYETSKPNGLQLNPINKGTESNDTITIPQLKSLDEWDGSMQEIPDEKFYIYYDFYKINNPHYHKSPHYGFHNMTDSKNKVLTPQLNRISFKLLPFPLLSGREFISDDMMCNETSLAGRDCTKEFCHCTHVLQVKLNSIVELILVDTGFAYDANHPFHLHGHSFRVVGLERLGPNVTIEKVKELDQKGLLKRNLVDAPVKDTVTVPDGGYTIIRFNASNPGYWIFHCHIEFHVEVGMALVFKFGENEEMPPIPRDFPQCGSFNQQHSHLSLTSSSRNSNVNAQLFITTLFISIFTQLIKQ